jgi:predicted ester cyclase
MVDHEARGETTIVGTPSVDKAGAPRTDAEVRDFFGGWLDGSNAGDWETVAALMHPDIVLSDPMMVAPARGRRDALDRVKGQYAPFPDALVEMLGDPFVSLSEPELVYRWRFSGTHLEPIVPPGFAATGRRVEADGVSVLRFEGGLVREATLIFDATDVARQILAAPPAGSAVERGIVLGQRLRAGLHRRRSWGRSR